MTYRRTLGLWLPMICLAIAGCGRTGTETLKAGGTVTYHKKPLADVCVTFTPESGRPATGETDAEGRFTLSTFQPDDGAVPGKHNVSISPSGAPTMPGTAEAKRATAKVAPFPVKFSNTRTSGLSANVEAGSPNDFTFDLTD